MTLVNLTGRPVGLVNSEGWIKYIRPENKVAKVEVQYTNETVIDGVKIKDQELVKVSGLPEPKEDTKYIVNYSVALASPDRKDLLVPDIRNTIKDKNGRTVGYPCLVHIKNLLGNN